MADALGLKAEQRFEYPPLNVATPLRYSRVSRRYFANWASCEAINASYHNFACSALEVEALRLINTLFKSKFYCFNYVSEWAPEAVTNWQNNLFLSAHTHTSNTHTHSSPTGYVLPTQSNHLARTHTHTLSITHTHTLLAGTLKFRMRNKQFAVSATSPSGTKRTCREEAEREGDMYEEIFQKPFKPFSK